MKWTTRDGAASERRIGLTELDVSRPRITSVRVRAGAESAARLTASVDAQDFGAARIAGRMVAGLRELQAAGALRTALGYARLDEFMLSARIGNAAIEEGLRPVDPGVLPVPGDFHTIEPTPGERFVTWDHVIGPDELEEELIPRLQTFPRDQRLRRRPHLPGPERLGNRSDAAARSGTLFAGEGQRPEAGPLRHHPPALERGLRHQFRDAVHGVDRGPTRTTGSTSSG